ncbi:MAG: flagellar basal body-associated protein FliL [Chthoniobacterales bacterium]
MNKAPSLFIAVVILFLAVQPAPAKTSSSLRNATVLIIRHAEKPDIGKDLSPAGVKRAQAYPAFFQALRLDHQPVKLDRLFAAPKSKNSDRCRETLQPLSRALQLKLNTNFDLSQSEQLADKVRHSSRAETILICWHHGAMPNLLQAFGASPQALLSGGKWPEDVFGWLVILHYDARGKLSAHVMNEGITRDDNQHPPPSS